MAPNDDCRSCVGWGGACGFGADAYNDSIDCLRSGLEEVGLEAALEGLPVVEDGGPPKKSRPSKDSPCLAGLCGTTAGPALVGFVSGMSAVFGLIGGTMGVSSPNRSMLAAGATVRTVRRTCEAPCC
jgi:hypothetical protein